MKQALIVPLVFNSCLHLIIATLQKKQKRYCQSTFFFFFLFFFYPFFLNFFCILSLPNCITNKTFAANQHFFFFFFFFFAKKINGEPFQFEGFTQLNLQRISVILNKSIFASTTMKSRLGDSATNDNTTLLMNI